ncbi:MAG: hypothetical protein WD768_17790 [Phycisphaeraceae bacterium]
MRSTTIPIVIFVVATFLLTGHVACAADNAADLYKRAMEVAEKMPENSYELLYDFDSTVGNPLTAAQIAAAEAAQPVAKLLLEAERMEACDWKQKFTSPWDAEVVDGLGSTRMVCRFIVLRAVHHGQQGRWKDAIDEAMAAWTMGRRLGKGRLAIHVLVQQSIDGMFTANLAAAAPSMPADARRQLLNAIDTLPQPESLKDGFDRDRVVVRDFLQDGFFKDIDGSMAQIVESAKITHMFEQMRRGLIEEKDQIPFDRTPFDAIGELAKNDPDKFRAHAKEMAASENELLKIFDVKPEETETFAKAWRGNLNAKNPLVKHLLEPVSETTVILARTSRRGEVMTTMLRAGLLYLDKGEEALTQVREPGTGKAFELVKTKSGFELRSSFFKDAGEEPWSLPFGFSPAE